MAARRALTTVSAMRSAVGPRTALRTALPVRGGDHGGMEPPYARLPKTKAPLHEQDELVWNDNVAPETALDFDAPHISKLKGLAMWLGGFGFFYSVWMFAKSTNHPDNKISNPRELPEETKTIAVGSYGKH